MCETWDHKSKTTQQIVGLALFEKHENTAVSLQAVTPPGVLERCGAPPNTE